jgi:hypothetical protein
LNHFADYFDIFSKILIFNPLNGLKDKIILKNGKMRKRFEQQMSLVIIPI